MIAKFFPCSLTKLMLPVWIWTDYYRRFPWLSLFSVQQISLIQYRWYKWQNDLQNETNFTKYLEDPYNQNHIFLPECKTSCFRVWVSVSIFSYSLWVSFVKKIIFWHSVWVIFIKMFIFSHSLWVIFVTFWYSGRVPIRLGAKCPSRDYYPIPVLLPALFFLILVKSHLSHGT